MSAEPIPSSISTNAAVATGPTRPPLSNGARRPGPTPQRPPLPRAGRSRRPLASHPARPSLPIGRAITLSDVLSPLAVWLIVVTAEWWLSDGGPPPPITNLFLFVGVTWGSFLFATWLLRLPGTTRRHLAPSAADGLGRATGAVLLGAIGVLAADTLLRTRFEPVMKPGYVVVGALASIVVLPASRALTLALLRRTGSRRTRVVVVGSGTIAADVAGRLARSRLVDFVGYVDDDPFADQQVLGAIGELGDICSQEDVNRVVVAFSPAHPALMADALRQLPSTVAVDVVPRLFDLTGWQAEVGDLDGLTVVSLGEPASRAGRATKRALDILGAAFGLALTLPLLALAAVAVRASSSGPILFRQTRMGRGRRPFTVLKFRTMSEPGLDGEQHITRIGNVLRRSGIDELPQFWNVLRGDMSLVGPRPFVAEECVGLPVWAERRFSVRPGMTGLWQVSGQHSLRMEELYRLDVQYVSTWSLPCDLRILAKTPSRLLQGGGDRDAFRRGHRKHHEH